MLVVFILGLLPLLDRSEKFHSDERLYTDATIRMVQTGDYWTPYFADGRIRLLKPIITYWVTAGSFQVFGVNLFAARLPFLLAGALLLGLTYQLAKTISNSRRVALLAALILASNVQIITLSVRCTPDALLGVFVLMSLWGFARIWFQDDKTFAGPLLAYAGMGLAVQTKGLLGICPLAVAILFMLFARPDAARTKRLLNWPAIILGLFLGLFWYVAMFQCHGAGALKDFFDDQVGAKVSRNFLFVFGNLAAYVFAGFRHFLPWTLIILIAAIWKRRELKGLWQQHKAAIVFLLALFAVLVVAFSFGNMRRTRYLAAAYPMLAIFLAAALSKLVVGEIFNRWLRRAGLVLAGVLVLAGTGLLLGSFAIDVRLAISAAVLLGLGGAGIWLYRQWNQDAGWLWLASVVFLVFAVIGGNLRPVFAPSPLPLVADALKKSNHPPEIPVHIWQVPGYKPGHLRILINGSYNIIHLLDETALADLVTNKLIIVPAPYQTNFNLANFQLREVAPENPLRKKLPWLKPLLRKETESSGYWFAENTMPAKQP